MGLAQMRPFKKRNNSDALCCAVLCCAVLCCQRRILSISFIAKATEFNSSSPITRPLNVAASKATDVQIARSPEHPDKAFEDLMRLVEGTDLRAMSHADWEKRAKAYLDARGLKVETLRGVEFGSDEFDYRTDEALGIHANRDHKGWPLSYPNERKLPSQLVRPIAS